MFRIFWLFTLALFVSASPALLRADTIDLFSAPASGVQAISVAAGGGNPSSAGPLAVSGLPEAIVFGGSRSIATTRTDGGGFVNMNVNTGVPGHLALGNDVSTGSSSSVLWDYAKSGFTANFAGAGSLVLDNTDVDVGQVDLSFTLSNGVATFTTPTLSVTGPIADADLLFSLAGVPANILSNVASLQLNINTFTMSPSAGSDLLVDGVLTTGTVIKNSEPGVPEPSSLAVCGLLAVAAICVACRRRRAAA